KLDTQLASDEEQLLIHESRCESLRTALANEVPFEEVVTDGPPKENPEHTALQQQLATLRNQETTIRGDGQDKPYTQRRVKALSEVIATVAHELETVPPTVARSSVKLKNPRHERLRGLLDGDELQVVALRVTRDREGARLERIRTWVRELDEIRP